jgi:hypothetical protein
VQDSDIVKQASRQARYVLEEQGTDRYADLRMAQEAALPVVVEALVKAIRKGLESGQLYIDDEGDRRVVRLAKARRA